MEGGAYSGVSDEDTEGNTRGAGGATLEGTKKLELPEVDVKGTELNALLDVKGDVNGTELKASNVTELEDVNCVGGVSGIELKTSLDVG